jgi:hypothetical protein
MELSLYVALVLCVITAILLVVALIAVIAKKPKAERLIGMIALVSAIASCSAYSYARLIISGGTLADWRVSLVLVVYIVAGVLSALSIVDGTRKLKAIRA